MKLTDTERNLITDNYNLVYRFLWKYHLNIEEWESILVLALCEKIHLYDDSKSQLSTFIFTVLKTAYLQELRSRNMQVRRANYDSGILSLDYEYIDEEGDTDSCCIDALTGGNTTNDPMDIYIIKSYIEYINTLKGKSADIYRDIVLNGMKQKDVAKEYNISKCAVSRHYRKTVDLVRKEFSYAC